MIRRTLFLLPLTLLLASCSVLLEVGGQSSSVPVNDGPRLDMVVDTVEDGRSGSGEARAAIRSIWTQDANLRSWFVLADRVSDADQTVFLNARVGQYDQKSERVGTPKYGYSTVYTVSTSVTFELIDARTGTVVAASLGRGSDRSDNGRADSSRALQRAIANGLTSLVRKYSGVS